MSKKILVAGVVISVFAIFGFMLYVDLNYCYENIFPSSEDSLRFPKCSDVFGVERASIPIVNSIYDAITGLG